MFKTLVSNGQLPGMKARALLEQLESRYLLSAAPSMPPVIEIDGTPGDDQIIVTQVEGDASRLQVTINDDAPFFIAVDADGAIRVNAGAGNDIVTIDTDYPARIHGGSGDDILTGGGARDLIFGEEDDDLIRGQGQSDQIHGGEGNDRIEGGEGNDYLFGGAGLDLLIGGDGDDHLDSNDRNHCNLTWYGWNGDGWSGGSTLIACGNNADGESDHLIGGEGFDAASVVTSDDDMTESIEKIYGQRGPDEIPIDPLERYDVNADGLVDSADVSDVIDYLNQLSAGGSQEPGSAIRFDVSRDGNVSPIDVLQILARIQEQNSEKAGASQSQSHEATRTCKVDPPLPGQTLSSGLSVFKRFKPLPILEVLDDEERLSHLNSLANFVRFGRDCLLSIPTTAPQGSESKARIQYAQHALVIWTAGVLCILRTPTGVTQNGQVQFGLMSLPEADFDRPEPIF